jgi:predicted histidine transporter YuiF (NhaC family)
MSSPLCATSIVLILLHSTYSALRYYGVHDKLPAVSDVVKPAPKTPTDKEKITRMLVSLRAVAWVCGAASLLLLPFSLAASSVFAVALLLSLGHFWFMEVDYKLKLQIRPFAYIAFVIGAAALVSAVVQE